MTMRLAGDKLSVVIRAGSSQTLSSIEGARDAIADRMAAIGQPLDRSRSSRWARHERRRRVGRRRLGGSRGPIGARLSEGDLNDAWSRLGAGRDRSY